MSKTQMDSMIINSNLLLTKLPDKAIWQQAMENLIVTNQPKDVKITIGKDVFECYSCVLRTFCELFADTMLPGKSLILPANRIKADAFAIAYNWMVSWDSQCLRGKLLDLLLAAEYLCAPKLLNSIYDALNNEAYFSNLDAVTCYIDASYKGIKDVADLMIERFGKSFLVILPSDEFHQMDVDSLCYLLSSDSLGVHTEVEVFYAALMWILSNYSERKVHLRRVMNTVRFELMPSLVLLNFGERIHEIMPGAVDLMLFLVKLAIINSNAASNKELKEVAEHHRIYIKDPLCPYLHLLEQRTEELNAMLFKDYIVSLQNKFEEFKARITEEEVEEYKEDDTNEDMMGGGQDDDSDSEEEITQIYMGQ